MTRILAALAALVTLGTVTGCVAPGMGGLETKVSISGGESVPIFFDSHGIVHAENDDVYIASAALMPKLNEGKKVTYQFAFQEKHHAVPRSVKVEDVTDDQAVTWVDDPHPTLDAKGNWEQILPAFEPDRSKVQWLYELETSIRVYRFTIVTADGRTLVMYEGANYPAYVKKFFRIQLGLEKVDKA